MFKFAGTKTVVDTAVAVIQTVTSAYGSGYNRIPERAYIDAYVLGYLNILIHHVIVETKRSVVGTPKEWDILAKVYERVAPNLAFECVNRTKRAMETGDVNYLAGQKDAGKYLAVFNGGVTQNSSPSVLLAFHVAEGLTTERPVPAEVVCGVLLSTDLFGHIRGTEGT